MYENELKELLENGFKVSMPSKFVGATRGESIKDLVSRLTELAHKANSSLDIVSFTKSMISLVDRLDATVKSDEFANLSEKAELEKYEADVASLKSNVDFVLDYLNAQQNVDQSREACLNISREFDDLNNREDLSLDDKTKETFRLISEVEKAQKAFSDAAIEAGRQEENYNKELANFDLNKFKESLNKAIDDLRECLQNLALNSNNKEVVESILNEIRSNVAYYGLDRVKSGEELAGLCQEYGLSYNESDAKSVEEKPVEVVNKEETEEKVSSFNNVNLNPNNDKKKNNIDWLLRELKRLNPESTFELAEATDQRFDAQIKSDTNLQNLILPNGYYYTSNSITNRYSSDEDVLTIEFAILPKKNADRVVDSIFPPVDDLENESMEDLAKTPVSPAVAPEFDSEETMDALAKTPAAPVANDLENESMEDLVKTPVVPAVESKEKMDDLVDWNAPQIDSVFEDSMDRLVPDNYDIKSPVVEERREVTKIRNAIMPKEVGNILALVGTTQVAKEVEGMKPGLLSQNTVDNLGGIIHTIYTDKVRDNENVTPSLENMADSKLRVDEVSERSDDLLAAYKRKLSRANKPQEVDELSEFEQQVHNVSRGIGR